MNKNMKNFLITIVIDFLFMYFSFSFALWDINAASWSVENRSMCIIIAILFIVPISVYFLGSEEK